MTPALALLIAEWARPCLRATAGSGDPLGASLASSAATAVAAARALCTTGAWLAAMEAAVNSDPRTRVAGELEP